MSGDRGTAGPAPPDRPAGREAEHIFEMSLDLICVAGFDGRFKTVNPAFARTLGYSPDELLERQFTDFVHPDDQRATLEAFGDVLEGGEVTQFENRYITKDGTERWLQWSSRAVPGQSVVYAIARDVTESRRITGEQAALRRVATLAARESSPVAILGAVTEEVARVLETEAVGMLRFEPDGTATLVAQSQTPWDPPPLGSRFTLEGENVLAWVHRTGQAARMDDWESATGSLAAMAHVLGVRSSVATPIVVEGRLWGTMIAATSQSTPLPADTESRLGEFTELVATAISNAESREVLTRLADEQAALRRVATLVAQGASAAAVFDAVAAEMERLLGADGVTLSRYEPDDEVTLVAHRGTGAEMAPAGTRLSLTGDNVASKVRRTRQPARKEDYEDGEGPIAELVRDIGVRATVGAPIVVEGRLWGLTVSQWRGEHEPPADTEERMVQFAELLGTAIANADNRDQLTASRARLLTAADEARRRVVRDLHDGAQQRLVHTIVALKLARRAFDEEDGDGGEARRRGPGARRAGHRGVARTRSRHPSRGSHTRRTPGRSRRPRGAARPAGAGRSSGRAASRRGRGECLLRCGRGADQHHEALARLPRRGDGIGGERTCSRWTSATTGSVEPTRTDTVWSEWRTV